MFDLRQLRYFVAVAEELSFTRAAQRLHISQPPLSQQIQALERALGARLLDRDKRNVSLTDAGKVLLDQARRILLQAETARAEVADVASGFGGRLRLAYTLSVAFHPMLPQALLAFGRHAPKVHLQLHEMYTEQQFDALATGRIDAGFVRGLPPEGPLARSLDVRILDREPLLLALPEAHPLATRASLPFTAVAGEAFVMQPRELAPTLYNRMVRLGATADFHPRVRQHAQQLSGLLALVSAGMGLALVPATMRAVRLSRVRYVALEDEEAHLVLAVACRRGDRSPALAHLLETVDSCRSDPL